MRTIFYDRAGIAVAYSEDGAHLWSFDGRPAGYVVERSVYDVAGRHRGWFGDGWVRDHAGRCVLFTESARGGPPLPRRREHPEARPKRDRPFQPPKPFRPHNAEPHQSWSERAGVTFFH